jgi:hypothetical protein
MNTDNSLGQSYVIPAKAGIQMKNITYASGATSGLVCFAERFLWLDSGLRRNDGLMDNLG